jgi:hypothetical protein
MSLGISESSERKSNSERTDLESTFLICAEVTEAQNSLMDILSKEEIIFKKDMVFTIGQSLRKSVSGEVAPAVVTAGAQPV